LLVVATPLAPTALAMPVNFSGTPAENKRHQPVMGEHTREILAEAGLSEEEVQAMLDSGATKAAD
jgi:crotonobetainyl-CoA:carnitine CoA-transferase CaiB-like acyl-CoA transferase